MLEQTLVLQTELYSVEILVTQNGLKRIRLLARKKTELAPLPSAKELPWLAALTRFLKDRLSAHPVPRDMDLKHVPLDLTDLTEFQIKTLRTLAETRKGETLTYRDLAERVGKPKAARAVGTVMRKNPFPVLIPCHRVVRTNGLGNYTGPQGQSLKAFLLGSELS